MVQPLISVICPVYMAEKYLPRCIESVIRQTLDNWELILVDDGSPDKSGELCDKYSELDKRIKVIHKSNSGVGNSRQAGLDASSAECVIHIDPDDWMDFNMLETMYIKMIEDNADMVICDLFYEYRTNTVVSSQVPTNIKDNLLIIDDILNHVIHGSCCNKLIRKSTIREYDVHFFEGLNYCEDVIFNVQLLKHPIKVSCMGVALYHYDQHSNVNSQTRTRSKSKLYQYKLYCDSLSSLLGEDCSFVYNLKLDTKKYGIHNGIVSKTEIKSIYPEITSANSKNIVDAFFYKLGFLGYVNFVKPYFFVRRVIVNFFNVTAPN